MPDKQDSNANKSGKWLENEIEKILNSYGIPSIKYRSIGPRFGNKVVKQGAKGFLIKHAPYKNVLGGHSRSEFVLQLANRGAIRIECRRQAVRGSVDEKVLYLFANAVACVEKEVILVVECNGMRKEAKQFLVDKAKSVKYKKLEY